MTSEERRALHELAERFRWFAETPDFSNIDAYHQKANGAYSLIREMGPMVAALIDYLAGIVDDSGCRAAIATIDRELDQDRAELPEETS